MYDIRSKELVRHDCLIFVIANFIRLQRPKITREEAAAFEEAEKNRCRGACQNWAEEVHRCTLGLPDGGIEGGGVDGLRLDQTDSNSATF